MPRQYDANKRIAILAACKSLFARKGYHATSISDIRRETGLSTGTIYHYFHSKDEIVSTIIEEGWQQIRTDLEAGIRHRGKIEDIADYLTRDILPRILEDEDLIHILMSEAVELSGLNEKLAIVVGLVLDMAGSGSPAAELSRNQLVGAQTAIAVNFLGILEAVRISRRTNIGFHQEDILAFVRERIIRDLGTFRNLES